MRDLKSENPQTESRIEVARGWGDRNGDLVFHEDRVEFGKVRKFWR